MIPGIEPLYRKIGESIPGRIDEPWTTARIDAIFYPDSMFYSGEYLRPKGGKPKSFPVQKSARNAFVEIRELFKTAGKPLWGRATFEMTAEGKFKMTWGYDDCDEQGFARFDADEEVERMRELRDRLA